MDVTKTLFHKSLFIRHLIVMPTTSYSHHLHLKERPINLLFFLFRLEPDTRFEVLDIFESNMLHKIVRSDY